MNWKGFWLHLDCVRLSTQRSLFVLCCHLNTNAIVALLSCHFTSRYRKMPTQSHPQTSTAHKHYPFTLKLFYLELFKLKASLCLAHLLCLFFFFYRPEQMLPLFDIKHFHHMLWSSDIIHSCFVCCGGASSRDPTGVLLLSTQSRWNLWMLRFFQC